MKAFTTRGNGIAALRLEDLPMPQPGPGQVIVRITAASLNYRDLLVTKGVEHWRPTTRRIPVSDGVGVVHELGDGARRFRRGDRVAGTFLPLWLDGELTAANAVGALGGPGADGVMSEFRVFDEHALVAVPSHLTDAAAATLPVAALTAWHAVAHRSRVGKGDRVLVQGTGGVSLFAMQFVRALGGEVIVTSSSDDKLERVRAMGAMHTINYRSTPAWEREVLELTDGRGVDHVIEVVGGANLNRSLEAVRTSGTISFIGLIAGLSAPIETYRFVMKNVNIHGIETGSRAMFEDMNRFLERHRIQPVLDCSFEFAELGDALSQLEAGQHFGKITLTF